MNNKSLRNVMTVLVGVELAVAAALVAWRLKATPPSPPEVEAYTDAVTGDELLSLPDRFLFDSVDKWRTLGETYMAVGFFAKAEACLRRAAEGEPRSPQIALSHGYCLERLGLLDEARDVYRRTAERAPRNSAATGWYRLGRIHLQREQPLEAAEAFGKAGDEHFPSVYQRARLLVRSGRAAEAMGLVDRLAEEHPDDVLVWQLRAGAAEALGGTAAAAEARDAVERGDRTLQLDEAHFLLSSERHKIGFERELAQATADRKAGRTGAAAERLTRLALSPTRWQNRDLTFLQDAAAVNLDLGNTAAARQLMEQQIQRDGFPTARAWELLGAVEFMEKHSDLAWACWYRAERMQPEGIDYDKLMRVAQFQGNEAAARRCLGLAQQFAGIEAFRRNALDEAATALRQAVSSDPSLADAWYYLGQTERLRGNRTAAAALQRCLQLDPAHGRARATLDRLAIPVP